MKIKIITLVVLILLGNLSIAQKSKGGYPRTLTSKYKDVFHKLDQKDKDKYTVEVEFDAEKEKEKKKEKDISCKTCTLPYYGKEIPVNIDFFKSADYHKLDDGGELWLLNLKTKNSEGYQFIFNNFELEEGCELIFYDKKQENFLGKFTEENNREDKLFVTQPIFGNEVYIEYYQPSGVIRNTDFILEKLVCIFDDSFMRKGPFAKEDNEDCMINTACNEGMGWDSEIKTVALILEKDAQNNYWGTCTGALINKVGNYNASDYPYFLTANHCYDFEDGTKANVSNWVFLFRHETKFCSSDGSEISNSRTKSTVGAVIMSRDQYKNKSDYLLLRLKDNVGVISLYDVAFAGWTNIESAAYSSKTVGIHHPKGDVKKISLTTNPLVSSNYEGGPPNKYWKLTWQYGVTAIGSSGSPLFNNNNQLIGQLWGGSSYCETKWDSQGNIIGGPDHPDFYGKFSESWISGSFNTYLGNASSCSSYTPTVPELQVSISSNPTIVIPGTNVKFTATSTNAIGNLTCWWVINTDVGEVDIQCNANSDSNCYSSNTNPTSSFYFVNSGSYNITCYAVDTEGRTAIKNFILNVGDHLDPCIDVNMYVRSTCNQKYAYPNNSELQIYDYAFAEFCRLWTGGPLKYDGIKAIKWYVDNNLIQQFLFNKTSNCFVEDNCYSSGQARACINLSTLSVGVHTIRMEAYAGVLTGGVFNYASGSPKSTISTKIRVYNPNSTINYNIPATMPIDQAIYHKEVSFWPTNLALVVANGHSMAVYADKTVLKPGVILANGSHCIFSSLTSDMANCTCTPIVKSALIDNKELVGNDSTNDEIKVYPNPVADNVIIDLGLNYKDVEQIEIFDSAGRLLFNQDCELNSINSIDMKDFNPGLFIVKISFPNKEVVRKLIKID